MPSQFLATPPEEEVALGEFLRRAFAVGPDVNSLRPEVLRWKYFSVRPGWEFPRSFIIKQNEKIVAHAGIWPLRFATSEAEVSGINVIDWASDASAPGSGVALDRRLGKMADTLWSMGQSEETRVILPKLGYRHVADMRIYARVVRPWRQHRRRSNQDWKSPLRLVRNIGWGLPQMRSPRGWRVEAIFNFTADDLRMEGDSHRFTVCRRSVEELNYLLRSPAAKLTAFRLLEQQTLRGYFVLSEIHGQTKIAALQLADPSAMATAAAYALAARTAALAPETCEIVAAACDAETDGALLQAGFRLRRSGPIFAYDPRHLLAKAAPLRLNLLDGDLWLLHNPQHPFLT